MNPKKEWTILVVDDVQLVREDIISALSEPYPLTYKDIPLKILQAPSALEAKEFLKADSLKEDPEIAVIFLDIVMEKADSGFEVVEYLRKELKNQKTQITIYSGQAGKSDVGTSQKKIPEMEEIVKDFDVNGFIEKAENSNQGIRPKIISQTLAGLRAFDIFEQLDKKNEELDFIISELERLIENRKLDGNEKELSVLVDNILRYKDNDHSSPYLLDAGARVKLLDYFRNDHIGKGCQVLFESIKQRGPNITAEMIDDAIKIVKKASRTWDYGKESALYRFWETLISDEWALQAQEVNLPGITRGPLIGAIGFSAFETAHLKGYSDVKIQWKGNINDLLYLYEKLYMSLFLNEEQWTKIHWFLHYNYKVNEQLISYHTIKQKKSNFKDDKKPQLDWSREKLKAKDYIDALVEKLKSDFNNPNSVKK